MTAKVRRYTLAKKNRGFSRGREPVWGWGIKHFPVTHQHHNHHHNNLFILVTSDFQ